MIGVVQPNLMKQNKGGITMGNMKSMTNKKCLMKVLTFVSKDSKDWINHFAKDHPKIDPLKIGSTRVDLVKERKKLENTP